MAYNTLSLLLAVTQLLAAWGIGRWAIGRLGWRSSDEADPSEALIRELTALGAGLIAMSIAAAVLAFFMLLRPAALALVIAAGLGSLVWSLAIDRPSRISIRHARAELLSVPALICLPFAFVHLLESFVPDGSGDAYLYHISVPLCYVLEGGFVAQPYEFCYNYPLAMEMLYTPALAFGLEQAAVLLNFGLLIAACAMLLALGTSLVGRWAAWAAVGLTLLSPLTVLWTPTTHSETGATFFILLLVALLRRWSASGRPQMAALAGWIAAGLIGAKLLYALFLLPVGALMLVRICIGRNPDPDAPSRRRYALGLLMFGGALAAGYAPWIIKNALYARNPIFPFALDRFATPEPLASAAQAISELHGLPPLRLLLPWIEDAAAGTAKLLTTGDVGFSFSLLCVPIAWALAVFRDRRERMTWSLMLALLIIVLHYGGVLQIRWFLPCYALFTLALGRVFQALVSRGAQTWMPAAGSVAVLVLVSWALGLRDRMEVYVPYHRPWTNLTAAGREAYLLTLPQYAPAQLVNSNVPPGARVLVMQPPPLSQTRWYERRFVQNGHLMFEELHDKLGAGAALARGLAERGITHVANPGQAGGARWAAFRDSHTLPLARPRPNADPTVFELVVPDG